MRTSRNPRVRRKRAGNKITKRRSGGMHRRDKTGSIRDDAPAIASAYGNLKWYQDMRRSDALPPVPSSSSVFAFDAVGSSAERPRHNNSVAASAYASRPLYQSWSQRDEQRDNAAAPPPPSSAAVVAPPVSPVEEDEEGAHGPVIHADGSQRWYDAQGRLHRDGDLPAFISANGKGRSWRQHGKLHRDGDQPAFIGTNGSLEWYQDGKRHREHDRPAQIGANGTRVWFQHGQQYRRASGKPAMERGGGVRRT